MTTQRVSTNRIKDSSVTTNKIADGAVTFVKTESGSIPPYNFANAAFNHANSAFIQANSAFLVGNGTAIAANTPSHVANSAAIYANGAFAAANAATATDATQNNSITAAFDHANSGFIQANSAFFHVNSAFDVANAAFIRANNSLDANLGGAITANVNITGNLQTSNVTVNSGLFFANTDLASSSISNGEIEFSENTLYATLDTTQGRGFVPAIQFYHMTANAAAAISTAALPVLGNNSGITLTANDIYEIDWNIYFLKTTAGTVTFAIRLGQAPQWLNAHYRGSVANTQGAMIGAGLLSSTATTATLPVTASLVNGAVYYYNLKTIVKSHATLSGNCYLQVQTSAGTMTPRIGSYVKVTRLPNTNTGVGLFA